MSHKNFVPVVIITLMLILILAIFDIVGVNLYLDSPKDVFVLKQTLYWTLIWGLGIILGIVISILYYIFRKDGTEAIGILVGYLLLLASGIEDVLFYVIQGAPLPSTFPWLYNSPQGIASKLVGESTVIQSTLFLNVFVFVSLAIIVLYILRNITLKRR